MKKKSFYLMLALVIISAASVNAQVLIGGNETDDPHEGAILDLSPGGSMNLGLLLPNAALTDDANVFALEGDGTFTPATATGMIVYNTANVLDGRGIYLWDGSKWTSIGITCPRSFTDERDGNRYFAGDFGAAGCWMTENLRYIPKEADDYSDYSPYNGQHYTVSEEKYYAFPRLTADGGDYPYPGLNTLDEIKAAWEGSEDLRKMGVFYNWAAAVNMGDGDGEYANPGDANQGESGTGRGGPTGNVKGICPSGWHLPSDAEWNDLEGEIALSAAGVYSSIGPTPWPEHNGTNLRTYMEEDDTRGEHSAKLKSAKLVSGFPEGASKPAEEGGFDALATGGVNFSSSTGFGAMSAFWSSSSYGDLYESMAAWQRHMIISDQSIWRGYAYRSALLSARCKKNN